MEDMRKEPIRTIFFLRISSFFVQIFSCLLYNTGAVTLL